VRGCFWGQQAVVERNRDGAVQQADFLRAVEVGVQDGGQTLGDVAQRRVSLQLLRNGLERGERRACRPEAGDRELEPRRQFHRDRGGKRREGRGDGRGEVRTRFTHAERGGGRLV